MTQLLDDRSQLRRVTPTFLAELWATLRDQFWFLPTVSLAAAVAAAATALSFDGQFDLFDVPGLSWTETTGASARLVLSTFIGSLVSVTGVTFSVMMLVLAQTSSQLGPRVVRTVVAGSELQGTLAVLIATCGFNLVTLQSIREASDGGDVEAFVPETAVALSWVTFAAAIAALVYFVNHVSHVIRVPDVLDRIAGELRESIDANLPDGPQPADTVETFVAESGQSDAGVRTPVMPPAEGYLEGVDLVRLMTLAVKNDFKLEMRQPVGSFVRTDSPVAEICGTGGVSEEVLEEATEAFTVGKSRSPEQDVESPILDLAEIAVRALSPGVNDPRTAGMCIDRLKAALVRIAKRPPPPSQYRDDAGAVRLHVRNRSFGQLLQSAFREIGLYSGGDWSVIEALTHGLCEIQEAATSDAGRRAVAAAAKDLKAQLTAEFGADDRYGTVREDLASLGRLG